MSNPKATLKGRVINASFAYRKLSDDAFLGRVTAVIQGLESNSRFPAPPVDLKLFRTDTDEFRGLIATARDGSRTAIAARDKKRQDLTLAMKHLTHYVEMVSNGDMEAFLSSGFVPKSGTRTPAQPLAPTSIATIEQGHPGQLLVFIQAIAKARLYELRYAALSNGTPGPWSPITVPTARQPVTIDGLTGTISYTFQVRAYGALGYTPWSDPITRICI